MPTSTFFRLPEEKRQRLLDAAWEEFSRTGFSDASINQIIRNAHIPRGSFYQYFVDKKELFWYLLDGIREYFFDIFQDALRDVDGDLFAVPVRAFDRFIGQRGSLDPVLARFIQVVRLNQGM
ncbi:MAG: TetR/AcrR family transcriptional regulator, partial [Lawsonibacter sp.]